MSGPGDMGTLYKGHHWARAPQGIKAFFCIKCSTSWWPDQSLQGIGWCRGMK